MGGLDQYEYWSISGIGCVERSVSPSRVEANQFKLPTGSKIRAKWSLSSDLACRESPWLLLRHESSRRERGRRRGMNKATFIYSVRSFNGAMQQSLKLSRCFIFSLICTKIDILCTASVLWKPWTVSLKNITDLRKTVFELSDNTFFRHFNRLLYNVFLTLCKTETHRFIFCFWWFCQHHLAVLCKVLYSQKICFCNHLTTVWL